MKIIEFILFNLMTALAIRPGHLLSASPQAVDAAPGGPAPLQ
jgi:hypothetical protein